MHMANVAQSPFEALLTWKPTDQEEAVPDREHRARDIWKWLKEYDEISVGEYQSVDVVTVTVAGATFVEKISEFPTIALYVAMALAVNTGNLRKLDWSERGMPREKRFWSYVRMDLYNG